MTLINRSALVPFSASLMYELVNNIEKYAEFLPWCKSTTVHQRQGKEVEASIEISKAGFNKTFTTRNVNEQNSEIAMKLVHGPFKTLNGKWFFVALDESACKVTLEIDFEFSNKLLDMSFGPIFGQICNTMVESFVKRAEDLYGKQ